MVEKAPPSVTLEKISPRVSAVKKLLPEKASAVISL